MGLFINTKHFYPTILLDQGPKYSKHENFKTSEQLKATF